MDDSTCPFCGGSARATGALTDSRRELYRCRDATCRGHSHWFKSKDMVSARRLFDRREIEERDKQRQA